MEISVSDIISIIGLLAGGGGAGWWLNWRYSRRKERADAQQAEASAAKELQDMYQQMVADAKADREDRKAQNEELRAERDHYKQERNEIRDRMDALSKSVMDWKRISEDERSAMKMQIAKLGRKVELMAPFMCGDLTCKLRQRVTISEEGVVKKAKKVKVAEVEPIDKDAL